MNHFWLQTCEMYGMMSMILKYSTLVVPYAAEKLLSKLSIVEVTIDTIASGHQLSRCIDLSMYRYTPSRYCI